MSDGNEPMPKWYWQDDDQKWREYDEETSNYIEAIYATHGETIDIDKYTINIKTRSQVNHQTKYERKIRRATWWHKSGSESTPVDESAADGYEAQFLAGQKLGGDLVRGFQGKTVAVAKQPSSQSLQVQPPSSRRLSSGSPHNSPQDHRKSREIAPVRVPSPSPVVVVAPAPAPVPAQSPAPSPAPVRIQVKPGLQKEGYVEKQSKGVFHKWETRYLILTSESFVTYKDRTIETKNIPVAQIRVADVDYSHQTSTGRVFAVRTSTRTYHFRVSTDDEAKEWVSAISIVAFGTNPYPKVERIIPQPVVQQTTTTTASPMVSPVPSPVVTHQQVVAPPMPGQPMPTSTQQVIYQTGVPGQPMMAPMPGLHPGVPQGYPPGYSPVVQRTIVGQPGVPGYPPQAYPPQQTFNPAAPYPQPGVPYGVQVTSQPMIGQPQPYNPFQQMPPGTAWGQPQQFYTQPQPQPFNPFAPPGY